MGETPPTPPTVLLPAKGVLLIPLLLLAVTLDMLEEVYGDNDDGRK